MKKQEPMEGNLPKGIQSSYGFTYNLSYEEAYDTFLVLAQKWSEKGRLMVGALLTIIAAAMLVLNFLDNRKVHYFFIAVIAVLLLFYLIYGPVLKAKRGAGKVQKKRGTYKIQITSQGKIIVPQIKSIDLRGDKDARVIETSKIFAVRTDRENTFCIPKRVMKETEIEGVRAIFKAYLRYRAL